MMRSLISKLMMAGLIGLPLVAAGCSFDAGYDHHYHDRDVIVERPAGYRVYDHRWEHRDWDRRDWDHDRRW